MYVTIVVTICFPRVSCSAGRGVGDDASDGSAGPCNPFAIVAAGLARSAGSPGIVEVGVSTDVGVVVGEGVGSAGFQFLAISIPLTLSSLITVSSSAILCIFPGVASRVGGSGPAE